MGRPLLRLALVSLGTALWVALSGRTEWPSIACGALMSIAVFVQGRARR